MSLDLRRATFSELVAFAADVTKSNASVAPMCETRIARALAAQRPVLQPESAGARAHRCDLARTWCAARGVPATFVPRALVCQGVRDALRLLLAPLARDTGLALPADVYPVYLAIARELGLRPHELETWPALDLERLLAACADASARVVVLPLPLKLHARAWTRAEVDVAAAWLRADPARRIVLDGVYSFGAPVAQAVLDLLATDQVLYLDSMSKGWLHEQTFGVAIVPERDAARLTDVVRAASPSASQLLAAAQLLGHFAATPSSVAAEIDARRRRLTGDLAARGIPFVPCARGYLVTVTLGAQTLLEEHGVLALPASVFGSARDDLSLASALSVDAT